MSTTQFPNYSNLGIDDVSIIESNDKVSISKNSHIYFISEDKNPEPDTSKELINKGFEMSYGIPWS